MPPAACELPLSAVSRDIEQWFASESEARAHALMQRTQFGEQRHAYRCPVCDGWHLSRTQPGGAAER